MRAHPLLVPLLLAGGLLPALLSAAAPGLNRAGGSARLTALGTDGQGRPVLAWTESVAGQGQTVFVRRLEGGAWASVGGPLNEDVRHNATQLSLTVGPDGTPSVGWAEDSGTAHVDSYLVSRLTDAGWRAPGLFAVRRNLSDAGRSRAFTPGPDGTPIIAWTNIYSPGAEGSVVQLLTWNGEGFTSSEPANRSLRRTAFFPSVAHRADGDVLVAWLEGTVAESDVYVSVRRGGAWLPLGGPLNVRPHTYTFAPQLRLAPDGQPVVAWQEDRSGVDTLFVKRWTGRGWQALGGPLNHDPRRLAERASLALDADGQPVIAWSEETADQRHAVYARRWQPDAARPAGTTGEGQPGRWVLLGTPAVHAGALSAGGDAQGASVTVAGDGSVYVAWCEDDLQGGGAQVRVTRLPGR